jgi:hypothetical protein
MRLLSGSHKSFIFRSELISYLISILATCGTFIVLIGGVWDASSHELRIPDTFWTVQHMTIYAGASIVALSAVIGVVAIVKGGNKKIHGAIMIIIVGSLAQLLGGYFDYNFHTEYGIDGLVTPSHLTVETGLLLSAIGGLIMISKIKNAPLKALIPISIITVLLSASWIGFNISLLLGAVVECVPVYQLFSSGCAVM